MPPECETCEIRRLIDNAKTFSRRRELEETICPSCQGIFENERYLKEQRTGFMENVFKRASREKKRRK